MATRFMVSLEAEEVETADDAEPILGSLRRVTRRRQSKPDECCDATVGLSCLLLEACLTNRAVSTFCRGSQCGVCVSDGPNKNIVSRGNPSLARPSPHLVSSDDGAQAVASEVGQRGCGGGDEYRTWYP